VESSATISGTPFSAEDEVEVEESGWMEKFTEQSW